MKPCAPWDVPQPVYASCNSAKTTNYSPCPSLTKNPTSSPSPMAVSPNAPPWRSTVPKTVAVSVSKWQTCQKNAANWSVPKSYYRIPKCYSLGNPETADVEKLNKYQSVDVTPWASSLPHLAKKIAL